MKRICRCCNSNIETYSTGCDSCKKVNTLTKDLFNSLDGLDFTYLKPYTIAFAFRTSSNNIVVKYKNAYELKNEIHLPLL